MSLFPFFVQPLSFMSISFVVTLISILAFIVQVSFGVGIYRDAKRLLSLRRAPILVPPWVWGVATGLGGFPIVALYWVMYYSTFSRNDFSSPAGRE
jgi:hypothetical protein